MRATTRTPLALALTLTLVTLAPSLCEAGQAGRRFLSRFGHRSTTPAPAAVTYVPATYATGQAQVQQVVYTPAPVAEAAPAPPAAEVAPAPEAAPVVEAAPAPVGDHEAHGFLATLNRYRASMGLGPVALDPDLCGWAHRNNMVQSLRGLGHHVNPNALQNCGWNYGSPDGVFQGWLNSPGHRANMLQPTITRIGLAHGPGPYWTMNAR